MKSAFTILLLVLSQTSIALIGGKTIEEAEYSRKLSRYTANFEDCTLVRISKKYFLAAAHCRTTSGKWNQANNSNLSLSFGSGAQNRKVKAYRTFSYVEWIDYLMWRDENIDFSFQSRPADLAVFEFKFDTSAALPIKVATLNLGISPKKGDFVYLTGYGAFDERTSANGTISYLKDGRFRAGKQLIIEVSPKYVLLPQYSPSDLEIRGSKGDSGGPLFNSNYEVIGVNGFIDRHNFQNIYTGVSRLDGEKSEPFTSVEIGKWVQLFIKN